MTLIAGTHLGHYEMLTPLGAGGMGEIHHARDTRLNREVSLKLPPVKFIPDRDRAHNFVQGREPRRRLPFRLCFPATAVSVRRRL